MDANEEASITEINLLPDGRICVFGSSRDVLEVLDSLELGDPALSVRVRHLRSQRRPGDVSAEVHHE